MKDDRIQRRVVGVHDLRMDGLTDLLMRAGGKTVLDLGCNRGLSCLEMAANGARIVHGCDNYEAGILAAREIFSDLKVPSKFEVVDLSEGLPSLGSFGTGNYDIILMLAVIHKIRRIMSEDLLTEMLLALALRTTKYIGWRGTYLDHEYNRDEMSYLDRIFSQRGLKASHYSYLSDIGTAIIWERV